MNKEQALNQGLAEESELWDIPEDDDNNAMALVEKDEEEEEDEDEARALDRAVSLLQKECEG